MLGRGRALTVAAERLSQRWRCLAIQVTTALVVFAVDHLTKWLVVSRLALGAEWPAGAPVVIHYVQNRGAAWSLFPQFQWIYLLAALGVAIYILGFGHRLGMSRYRQLVLGLILGGAVSNALDRMTQGYVVDFLDLRRWPVFNVADSCIVVGIVLAILTFRTRSHASTSDTQ